MARDTTKQNSMDSAGYTEDFGQAVFVTTAQTLVINTTLSVISCATFNTAGVGDETDGPYYISVPASMGDTGFIVTDGTITVKRPAAQTSAATIFYRLIGY